MLARQLEQPVRGIIYRTSGHTHGPITRLVSPSDLGELIKPFVFLDHFDFRPTGKATFPMHPHSGIATLTLLLAGAMRYEDTTGAHGELAAGSLEWLQAGGGGGNLSRAAVAVSGAIRPSTGISSALNVAAGTSR